MKKLTGIVLIGLCCSFGFATKIAPVQSQPVIQLAILLDTSGSMDGLINQARTQLWRIVNELATAKRDGQIPPVAGGALRVREK